MVIVVELQTEALEVAEGEWVIGYEADPAAAVYGFPLKNTGSPHKPIDN